MSIWESQEIRAKNAKENKPTKSTPTVATTEVKKGKSGGRQVGASTMPESEILTDPDRALKRQEDELGDPYSARIEGVYERIASILAKNDRAAEAQKFTQKLNAIRSRLH